MKIIASSDLHLDQHENLASLKSSLKENAPNGEDCLILAGDICETENQLKEILSLLRPHFKEIVWLPGNHELWIRPSLKESYLQQGKGSEQRYLSLVTICHEFSVHTPEDPYIELSNTINETLVLVPMFLLYDYSFRPTHVPESEALNWAMESNVMCSDEVLIVPEPYKSIIDWCHQRVEYTLQRLNAYRERENDNFKFLFINHFPLREDCFHLQHIPRFSIWCGTKRTEQWHVDYPVKGVVSGHLHLPSHQIIDDVEFFEVSLGYPGQWDSSQNMFNAFIDLFPAQLFHLE
jgi:UDP-2,3-diacylglucosamine pyrophosphatase LpxH